MRRPATGLTLGCIGIFVAGFLVFWGLLITTADEWFLPPPGPDTYPDAQAAERGALRKLSRLLRARPREQRYTITYDYEGTHFGGIVSKVLTFNPARHTLFDQFESTRETRLLLSGVTVDQIHAAARRGATFDALRPQRPARRRRTWSPASKPHRGNRVP